MIKRKAAARRQSEQKRGRTYALILVCGLLVVSGFFFAGRQHFSSMDYGMKNSRLRKQIDDLESEKRRLLLAREISSSPMEIKKAAKKVGFGEPSADQPQMAQLTSVTKDKGVPPTAAATAAAPDKSLIVRTALVKPVPQAVTTALVKNNKTASQPKRTMSAE
ncbi:MAG: hypothetical protein WBC19_10210 [Pyrinomonadaceae bacterium]|nr:hypothetical protein [Chloracidobacterium sp.]